MPVVFSTSLSMLTACTDGASEGIGKSRDPRAVLTGADLYFVNNDCTSRKRLRRAHLSPQPAAMPVFLHTSIFIFLSSSDLLL